MKTKLFVSALCLFLGVSTFAQTKDNKQAPKEPVFPSEQMIKDLNLNTKQVAQMKAFMEEQKTQREQMRKEAKADRQKTKEEMKARRVEADKRKDENLAKMKAILTPEQYTKYLEMRAKHQPKAPKDGRMGKGKPRAEKKGNCGNCPDNAKTTK